MLQTQFPTMHWQEQQAFQTMALPLIRIRASRLRSKVRRPGQRDNSNIGERRATRLQAHHPGCPLPEMTLSIGSE